MQFIIIRVTIIFLSVKMYEREDVSHDPKKRTRLRVLNQIMDQVLTIREPAELIKTQFRVKENCPLIFSL